MFADSAGAIPTKSGAMQTKAAKDLIALDIESILGFIQDSHLDLMVGCEGPNARPAG